MRTFLNHIKNETLDEIETSLENLWQQMIQLSEFFQYSFVLILKRKCLVRACRVRSAESGTPSTIIYTRWSSRRYELGCDTPVIQTASHSEDQYTLCYICGIPSYQMNILDFSAITYSQCRKFGIEPSEQGSKLGLFLYFLLQPNQLCPYSKLGSSTWSNLLTTDIYPAATTGKHFLVFFLHTEIIL